MFYVKQKLTNFLKTHPDIGVYPERPEYETLEQCRRWIVDNVQA